MRYIIASTAWLEAKGVSHVNFRHSLDGTKAIVHKSRIKPLLTDADVFDVYEFDSPELAEILNSEEWVEKEGLDEENL